PKEVHRACRAMKTSPTTAPLRSRLGSASGRAATARERLSWFENETRRVPRGGAGIRVMKKVPVRRKTLGVASREAQELRQRLEQMRAHLQTTAENSARLIAELRVGKSQAEYSRDEL